MSPTEITQLITAIGTLIGIIVTAILTLRNGWKTDVVAAHVNSSATRAQEEIRALQAQVSALLLETAEKKQIAALLAQRVTLSAPSQVEITNDPTNPVPVSESSIIRP